MKEKERKKTLKSQVATGDHKSCNEETLKIVIFGKEAFISKEEKTSMQVKTETCAVREAQMKIRYPHLALFCRSISTIFGSKAFLVNKVKP